MVPFGFSAGDFAAALHLIHKAATALRETDGASSDFSYTILQLIKIKTILSTIQGLQASKVDAVQVEELQFIGLQCQIPLEVFLKQLRAIEPELRQCPNATRNPVRRGKSVFRKIQWGLRLKKHVEELYKKIAPQLQLIDIQLEIISIGRQTETQVAVEEIYHSLQSLHKKYNGVQTQLHGLNNSIAAISGYSFQVLDKSDRSIEICVNKRLEQTTVAMTEAAQACSGVATAPIQTTRLHDGWMSQSKLLATQNELAELRIHMTERRREGAMAIPLQTCTQCWQQPTKTPDVVKVVRSSTLQQAMVENVKIVLDYLRAGVQLFALKIFLAQQLLYRMVLLARTILPTPSMLLSDSIQFEDALGRIAYLPYAHFRHRAVFMERLRCEFKGLPGEYKVIKDEFHIMHSGSTSDFVAENNWEQVIVPRVKLSMSVIFRRVYKLSTFETRCPRCYMLQSGTLTLQDLHLCASCGLKFAVQRELTSPAMDGGTARRAHKDTQKTFKSGSEATRQVLLGDPDNTPEDLEAFKALKAIHIHPLPGSTDTRNAYFVPGYGISRSVISSEIRYYCGPDAAVSSHVFQGRDGFLVRTAGPPLTKAQIEDLKISSRAYEERASWKSNGYESFINQPIVVHGMNGPM